MPTSKTPLDEMDMFGTLLEYQQTDEFIEEFVANRQVADEVRRDSRKRASQRYQERHPDANMQRQRARQQKAILSERQNGLCYLCRKPLGDKFSVDHIYPLYLGGSNEIDNLCAVHTECNEHKAKSVIY